MLYNLIYLQKHDEYREWKLYAMFLSRLSTRQSWHVRQLKLGTRQGCARVKVDPHHVPDSKPIRLPAKHTNYNLLIISFLTSICPQKAKLINKNIKYTIVNH